MGLGYIVSCVYTPGGLVVGPYSVSAGPVTIIVNPVCDHNVVVLP